MRLKATALGTDHHRESPLSRRWSVPRNRQEETTSHSNNTGVCSFECFLQTSAGRFRPVFSQDTSGSACELSTLQIRTGWFSACHPKEEATKFQRSLTFQISRLFMSGLNLGHGPPKPWSFHPGLHGFHELKQPRGETTSADDNRYQIYSCHVSEWKV